MKANDSSLGEANRAGSDCTRIKRLRRSLWFGFLLECVLMLATISVFFVPGSEGVAKFAKLLHAPSTFVVKWLITEIGGLPVLLISLVGFGVQWTLYTVVIFAALSLDQLFKNQDRERA